MAYDIEIGASQTIHKQAGTLYQVRDVLRDAQGSVSIADLDTMTEVFCGTADQAREWVAFELEITG